MRLKVELIDGDTSYRVEEECTPTTAYDVCGWLMVAILAKSQTKLTLEQRISLLPWNDEVIYFGSRSLQ